MKKPSSLSPSASLLPLSLRRGGWGVRLLLAVALFSCHKHSYDIEPDTIRFHLPQDPILLNPVISEDAYSNVVCSRIFESLLERDRKTQKMKDRKSHV